MIHVVCYSGGHSSALTAIEVVRKYGNKNVMLLNHDISSNVEHKDTKRFKQEVADYVGLNIVSANMKGWETMDQFDVCVKSKAFKVGTGTEICTSRLKTQPFHIWLKKNCQNRKDYRFYYGFDKSESSRIEIRTKVMNDIGFDVEFPRANWKETIGNIEEVGINKPEVYKTFKHANCIGCLKAGKQHWYIVYCLYPHVWEKAKWAESQIGYSIIKNNFLRDLEKEFRIMKQLGIVPTEKIQYQKFWAEVRKKLK